MSMSIWDLSEADRRARMAARAARAAGKQRRQNGAKPRDVLSIATVKLVHNPKTNPNRDILRLTPDFPPALHWKRIVLEVCDEFGVTFLDLVSERRDKILTRPRQKAMYRLRHETTMSLPAIGRRLGGRDHSTVHYGIRRHRERMETGHA